MEAGRMKKKTPQIRLAMAFPLVGVGTPGMSGGGAVAVAAETPETGLPHTAQNRSPGARALPHCAQLARKSPRRARDLSSWGTPTLSLRVGLGQPMSNQPCYPVFGGFPDAGDPVLKC